MGKILLCIFIGLMLSTTLNQISYRIIKRSVLKSRKWDLNICCGKTDGGGINADIRIYSDLPRFILVNNIYSLPFETGVFDWVLCSHTMEHVEFPELFFKELCRVGKNVVILVPPLWDITAAVNIFEHKWLFLTLKSKHSKIPAYIRLPLANLIHNTFGQKIKA